MINLITVSRNLNINHTFIQLIKESFLLCLIVRLRITLDSERKSYFPLIDFRITLIPQHYYKIFFLST